MVNPPHNLCLSRNRVHFWSFFGVLTYFGSAERTFYGNHNHSQTSALTAPQSKEALRTALTTSPSLPTKLACNLEVLHKVGAGEQGKAYLAKLLQQCYGLDLGAHVVLKVMPVHDKSAVREGMILQYLTFKSVRHTIRYYDMASNGTDILLVESVAMGIGPWERFDAYLEANTTNDKVRLNIFKQLAEAYLDWCKAGVIHKDSNFENRLASSDGIVTLIDLGLAEVSGNNTKKIGSPGCSRDTFLFALSDETDFQKLNVMNKKPSDEVVINSYEQVLKDFQVRS